MGQGAGRRDPSQGMGESHGVGNADGEGQAVAFRDRLDEAELALFEEAEAGQAETVAVCETQRLCSTMGVERVLPSTEPHHLAVASG